MSKDSLTTSNDELIVPLTAHDRALELGIWLALLLLANLGLLWCRMPATWLMYDPAAVANGEWWRLVTWPWAHVSRYHLLLDGFTFLLLYHGLAASSRCLRLGYLLGAIAGSLLLPLFCAPQLTQLGLCGLSGPAHGLMTISALELISQRRQQWLGSGILIALLAKSAWELWSGTVFLQQLHFGEIGVPIVATHAGGVLGGLLAFALGTWCTRRAESCLFRHAVQPVPTAKVAA